MKAANRVRLCLPLPPTPTSSALPRGDSRIRLMRQLHVEVQTVGGGRSVRAASRIKTISDSWDKQKQVFSRSLSFSSAFMPPACATLHSHVATHNVTKVKFTKFLENSKTFQTQMIIKWFNCRNTPLWIDHILVACCVQCALFDSEPFSLWCSCTGWPLGQQKSAQGNICHICHHTSGTSEARHVHTCWKSSSTAGLENRTQLTSSN